MSDIPEDVRRAVSDILANATMLDGHFFDPFGLLARAILAERERCAQIADEQENYHLRMNEGARAGTANIIALEIRSGADDED